jgi:ribonuclease P protein component
VPRFTRSCWLLRTGDFDRVYREGRKRTSRHFAIFFRPNAGPAPRFGISAKKSLGTAVRRNRMRRRIREIVRVRFEEIAPGWDIVIHPRSSVATAEFGPLAAELIALIRAATGTEPAGKN